MTITVAKLKNNLDKYLDLAQTEDIYVNENDKIVVKLSSANVRPLEKIDGVFKDYDITDDEIKEIKNDRLLNWNRQ